MAKTLFDKIWDRHTVATAGSVDVIYIDQHFIHEVTSPQAFQGLRDRGIDMHRTDRTLGTADHNVPTKDQHKPIENLLSRKQVDMLISNCDEFGVTLYGLGHAKQGIVHVIGPELGYTRPGMTIVCGDSHTSTHGAFGNIAFGIGTSQVEQVMATQCLVLTRPKNMRISVNGQLREGVSSKDVILYIISQLGTAGATEHFVEYDGDCIQAFSMEARMTVCNMSIEMGARGGLIQPDETTFAYLKECFVGSEADYQQSLAFYKTLKSDPDAQFDVEHSFRAEDITPMVTYGTNPGMGMGIDQSIPADLSEQAADYMDLHAGESLLDKPIQHVFIGSCTNSRMEDLRLVADYVKGKKKADGVSVMIVPGSKKVEQQAIKEGLHTIFAEAGFELREPGCSACLGMNDDKIPAGEYCVSTSNRNFQGRQGPGARTILASPLMAAAAAVHGRIIDVSKEIAAYETV